MVASRKKNDNPEGGHAVKKQATDVLTHIDEICINTIRGFGADAPFAAKSGHPGAPIGCAPMAQILFGHIMKFNPKNPDWINRDRFLLSNGHACVLQYTMLHLAGYDLSIEDLKNFRQLHSKTPGHPEIGHAPGIEVTTGPLGQGISNAVGLAIGSHHMAAKYNKPNFNIFDNFIFCICGDGCLQEGIASEACSLAGHLGLGRLIVLYDSNKITIDGSTNLSFTENVLQRFEAYGWHTQTVKDGDKDLAGIMQAINKAKQVTDKPSIIEIHTTIGWGSVNEGTEKVHGAPLSADDVKQLKKKLNLNPEEAFQVPEETRKFYAEVASRNKHIYDTWTSLYKKYGSQYPQEHTEINNMFNNIIDKNVEIKLREMAKNNINAPAATRALSGKALNAIKDFMPQLIGGSADLTTSNETRIKDFGAFSCNKHFGSPLNKYIYFGVREHAMCAISNGLVAYGCFRPFAATFLNFFTYAWGAVRLSALSKLCCLFIATHDSIELGEDGPTHQAIEVIPACRALPNLLCTRPADANEVAAAYLLWLQHKEGPTIVCLSRGALPPIEGSSVDKAMMGAYVVSDFNNNGKPKVIIAGSGSELHMCVEAKEKLKNEKDVRVVSFLCWEVFEKQTNDYKNNIIMKKERREGKVLCAYVEAAATLGWEKYFDIKIGMTTFGASAPRAVLWKEFGFTADNIIKRIKEGINNNN